MPDKSHGAAAFLYGSSIRPLPQNRPMRACFEYEAEVWAQAQGYSCVLSFNRRVGLVPGAPMDGSMVFGGYAPDSAQMLDAATMQFSLTRETRAETCAVVLNCGEGV